VVALLGIKARNRMRARGDDGYLEEHLDECTDYEGEEEEEAGKPAAEEVPETDESRMGMPIDASGGDGISKSKEAMDYEFTVEQLKELAKRHGLNVVKPRLPEVNPPKGQGDPE
jgi:hypothetical protein